jgi:hypothetical protein
MSETSELVTVIPTAQEIRDKLAVALRAASLLRTQLRVSLRAEAERQRQQQPNGGVAQATA